MGYKVETPLYLLFSYNFMFGLIKVIPILVIILVPMLASIVNRDYQY